MRAERGFGTEMGPIYVVVSRVSSGLGLGGVIGLMAFWTARGEP